MTKFSKNVWNQIKGKTLEDIEKALRRDGWEAEETKGATRPYRHPARPPASNRIVLHYHPKKTYGPKMLKQIISDIGWTEDDLRHLKLIK